MRDNFSLGLGGLICWSFSLWLDSGLSASSWRVGVADEIADSGYANPCTVLASLGRPYVFLRFHLRSGSIRTVRVAAVGTGKLAFGQFRLDRANALLWRGQDRVLLAPKPFEVLCCLIERPGELVTKDELLDAVWSDLHVSESSLTVAMNALRSALGDDRQAPNYIETVTRRGYRFIASVTAIRSSSAEKPIEEEASVSDDMADQRRSWRVGRAVPLEILESVLQQVQTGRRQVVFVTGEAGIGKTTFVQMAMERAAQRGMVALHSGCSELFGTHEAFLPLIEALHELCRGADGPSLLKSLRDHAPTWLAQMPGFLREEDRAAFQQEVFGATRERMLRD